MVPQAFLFPGVNFNPEYRVGFPDNFYLGYTKNGLIEILQFNVWLINHFVKYILHLHPMAILLDLHSSRIDFYVVELCAAHEILLFCLPPHSSNVLQPADREFWHFYNQKNIFCDLYISL